MPPTNMAKTAKPKMTASVTIAPMTPATALDTPPPPDDDLVAEAGEAATAQTPVEFPHARHQDTWSLTANLFMLSTNVVHGKVVSFWPKSGKTVGSLLADVVPL